jgi:hypothetical protein
MAITSTDVLSWLGDNSGDATVATQVQRCLDSVTASIEQRCDLPPEWPNDVQQAVVMAAARLYRRKASGDGIVSVSGLGVIRVGSFDADIEAILANYLRFSFS